MKSTEILKITCFSLVSFNSCHKKMLLESLTIIALIPSWSILNSFQKVQSLKLKFEKFMCFRIKVLAKFGHLMVKCLKFELYFNWGYQNLLRSMKLKSKGPHTLTTFLCQCPLSPIPGTAKRNNCTQPDSHYIRYTAASALRSTTLSTPEGHWLTCAW